MEKSDEVIRKYGKEAAAFGGSKLMLKTEGGIFETADGANLAALQPCDIIKSGDSIEARLLLCDEHRNALVLSHATYCEKAAKRGKCLTAALDDMAQIVGCRVETVDYDEEEIKRAMENAEGCFVRDRYTMTMGRSLFEAVVALEVLEKSAEVNLKAEVLGGICEIEAGEAAWMRRNYVENYSRKEQEVKTKEGR